MLIGYPSLSLTCFQSSSRRNCNTLRKTRKSTAAATKCISPRRFWSPGMCLPLPVFSINLPISCFIPLRRELWFLCWGKPGRKPYQAAGIRPKGEYALQIGHFTFGTFQNTCLVLPINAAHKHTAVTRCGRRMRKTDRRFCNWQHTLFARGLANQYLLLRVARA